MTMSIEKLLERLEYNPDLLTFSEVLEVIQAHYDYKPTRFVNGELVNEAGKNEGSCKVFAFAQLQSLSVEQTLKCFAEHYRSVLAHPEAQDHVNIRNFMCTGWEGVKFDGVPLSTQN